MNKKIAIIVIVAAIIAAAGIVVAMSGSDSEKYTIEYDGNGAPGSTPDTKVPIGSTATVSANKFDKYQLHEFKCWNTKKDGSGTNYSPGAKITPEWSLTLYAQWTPFSILDCGVGSHTKTEISGGSYYGSTYYKYGGTEEMKVTAASSKDYTASISTHATVTYDGKTERQDSTNSVTVDRNTVYKGTKGTLDTPFGLKKVIIITETAKDSRGNTLTFTTYRDAETFIKYKDTMTAPKYYLNGYTFTDYSITHTLVDFDIVKR